jgi:branched-subunit amino acid permease
MTRILPSSEADWTSGERLFVRTVQQFPPAKSAARVLIEGLAFIACMTAVVGLIVAVAPAVAP